MKHWNIPGKRTVKTLGTAKNGIYFQQKKKELVIVFNVFSCRTTSQQSFQSWPCLGAQMLQALCLGWRSWRNEPSASPCGHQVLSQHAAGLADRGAEVGEEAKAWMLCSLL